MFHMIVYYENHVEGHKVDVLVHVGDYIRSNDML